MKEVKAKKALGQHFLNNEEIARRIALTISAEEIPQESGRLASLPVVEIGPGMGVLSKYVVEQHKEVKAVEIDHESVVWLSRNLPNLQVVEGDFLEIDPSRLWEGEKILIGNYPYNISSQIFFRVLDFKEQFPVVAGMLQKEVAERICSQPGGKTRGILSVLLQAWYDCEYLFEVGPENFTPPPKVQSAVIRLIRNKRTDLGCDEKLFKTVVKTTFGQRRKTLRNSISSLLAPTGGKEAEALLADPMMKLRPERLSVEDFIYLTRRLEECRRNV